MIAERAGVASGGGTSVMAPPTLLLARERAAAVAACPGRRRIGDAIPGRGIRTMAALRYSGMLPCFLGGRVWRLLRSVRSARVTWDRVSAGRMTASM